MKKFESNKIFTGVKILGLIVIFNIVNGYRTMGNDIWAVAIKKVILFCLGIFMVLFAIMLGRKLVKIVRKTRSLNKDDFNKKIDYYREILKMNSPLILKLVDSFKIDENTLVAELLYLEYVGAVTIQDGRVEKNSGFYGQLHTCDKFFLSKFVNGKIKLENEEMFYKLLSRRIEDDAKRKVWNGDGLVENRERKYINLAIIPFIFVGIYLLIELFVFLKAYLILSILIFLVSMAYGYWSGVYSIDMWFNFGDLKRTKEGEKLNKEIEGIKIFLKDYSLLNEKSSEHLVLWDEYLIYSVLFDQNKKIVDEYWQYVETDKVKSQLNWFFLWHRSI